MYPVDTIIINFVFVFTARRKAAEGKRRKKTEEEELAGRNN